VGKERLADDRCVIISPNTMACVSFISPARFGARCRADMPRNIARHSCCGSPAVCRVRTAAALAAARMAAIYHFIAQKAWL